jgi:hypothetical protein
MTASTPGPDPRARAPGGRRAKTLLRVTVVLAIVWAALTAWLLPPRAGMAPPADMPRIWPTARGAYHVHSGRSDGTGNLDEIASAARVAGLQFVIVTDHGDGTRDPEPPAYRSGVLTIDGVEISTSRGHYVAIGLPAAPYPIAGDPRDVIEDVRRLGGFGFAAHPGSPKSALRWTDWDAAFDGIEWLNADSEWRDETWPSLGGALLAYPFRPAETLAALLHRPNEILERWDRLAQHRRVPAIAGADAHARLGFQEATDPYEDRVIARVPSYEVSFRAFTTHVVLNAPLTGQPAADARGVIDALREGRLFTTIDGAAHQSGFEARGTSGASLARVGEYLDPQGPVTISAEVLAPGSVTLVVFRDGHSIYDVAASKLRLDVGTEPGAYRVEAHLSARAGHARAPWILTNPIYVGLRDRHLQSAADPTRAPATSRTGLATALWQAEASAGSRSTLRSSSLADGTPALEWEFALAGGARANQYAALRLPVEQVLAEHDRLQVRVEGDGPRRVWAQMRSPDPGGERWGRTFYVDDTLRAVELPFDDFRPVGPVPSSRPPLDRMDSLLFVVDTLNTVPGTAGRVKFTDMWIAKRD